MARPPRGTGVLLLVAAVIVAMVGAVVYRATRPRPPVPCFLIFHWIPNPATVDLKISGSNGQDLSGELDPRLFALLRSSASGELRLVSTVPLPLPKPQAVALLLLESPVKAQTLPLFDSREAVYLQAGTGYSFHPGGALPLKESISITPGQAGSINVLRRGSVVGVPMRWW
jgi:hypothetical protein